MLLLVVMLLLLLLLVMLLLLLRLLLVMLPMLRTVASAELLVRCQCRTCHHECLVSKSSARED
jgi:hypothetical protein